jgi:hypothetical protein
MTLRLDVINVERGTVDEEHIGLARGVVLAMLIAFAFQLLFVQKVDEPYPALMMPRFGWAGPSRATAVDVTEPEIVFTYADHTQKRVDQQDLLSAIPVGHQSIIVGNILSPVDGTIPSRSPSGRFSPPEWLFPGYGLARVARNRPENVRSLAVWLRDRASAFYRGAAPVRCTVNWFTDEYRTDLPADANVVPSRSLKGQFAVDLGSRHAS